MRYSAPVRWRTLVVLAVVLAAGCKKEQPGTPAPTPAPTADAAPAPPPAADAAAWEPDRSCSADSECVPAPSCCPVPCNQLVINVRDVERAKAELLKNCPPAAQCPSAGACVAHQYLCMNGRCSLVFQNSPAYRLRQE
jgi:hypothetical protein